VLVSEFIARLTQDEGEDERADAERHTRDPGETVEVALDNCRTAEARGAHPASEDIGKTSTFTRVQQHKGNYSQAEEDMNDYEKCFNN
jgi:hypothetical protein